MNYSQFTDSARNVFVVANREAQALHHEYIGSGHVLLGLLAESSRATEILKEAHLDPEAVRITVTELLINPGASSVSSDAKTVIAATLQEAHRLDHDVIDTAHILLGILASPDSLAAAVFDRLCPDTELLRRAAQRCIDDLPKAVSVPWDQYKNHPEVKPLVERLNRLQQLKEAAITEREFEEAARLRDESDRLTREVKTVVRRIVDDDPGE